MFGFCGSLALPFKNAHDKLNQPETNGFAKHSNLELQNAGFERQHLISRVVVF